MLTPCKAVKRFCVALMRWAAPCLFLSQKQRADARTTRWVSSDAAAAAAVAATAAAAASLLLARLSYSALNSFKAFQVSCKQSEATVQLHELFVSAGNFPFA